MAIVRTGYANFAAFPVTGAINIIYVDLSNGNEYTWIDTAYVAYEGTKVFILLGYKNAAWFTANATLILGKGQIVYLEQTGTYKLGTGVTQLSALSFLGGGAGAFVESVTGDFVDNTDPLNPVISGLQDALDAIQDDVDTKIPLTQKGAANGVATLDGSGLVPASQLPSYVDDILEYANLAAFPLTGEQGKIYVALDTGFLYRWSGSVYIQVSNLSQTLSETLAIDNKTGGQTITSDDTNASLSVFDNLVKLIWTDGLGASAQFFGRAVGNLMSWTNGTVNARINQSTTKTVYEHDVLNEFNAPENNVNGRVTVVSDTDNDAIKLIGADSLFKVVIYNDDENAGLVSVRDDSASETIQLKGKTGFITANKFIKVGGLSSQFLKADGSVDSVSYLNTSKLITQSFTYTGSPFTLSNTVQYVFMARLTNGIVLDDTDALDLTISGTTATVTNPTFTTGDKFIIKYLAA